MQIFQSTNFKRTVKKLYPNQKICLDEAIRIVESNPLIGTKKLGDLSEVFVYKFHILEQLALLAYKYNELDSTIILLALGSHENFYRNLKTQLD